MSCWTGACRPWFGWYAACHRIEWSSSQVLKPSDPASGLTRGTIAVDSHAKASLWSSAGCLEDRLGNLLLFRQRCGLWGTGQEQHCGIRSSCGKGLERGTIGGRHIRHDLNGRGVTTRLVRELAEHGTALLDQFWGAPGRHPAIAIGHRPFEHLPRRTPEKNGRVRLLHPRFKGLWQRMENFSVTTVVSKAYET